MSIPAYKAYGDHYLYLQSLLSSNRLTQMAELLRIVHERDDLVPPSDGNLQSTTIEFKRLIKE